MIDRDTMRCPECNSPDVTVSHIQKFKAGTGEHYCHSVKTHDPNSPADCLCCGWSGLRRNLVCDKEVEE